MPLGVVHRWGAKAGAHTSPPAHMPLPVHACMGTLLLVPSAKPGRARTGPPHPRCALFRAHRAGEGVEMGAAPSPHPVHRARRGQQGGRCHIPRSGPPPRPLSENAGVREGPSPPPRSWAPLACVRACVSGTQGGGGGTARPRFRALLGPKRGGIKGERRRGVLHSRCSVRLSGGEGLKGGRTFYAPPYIPRLRTEAGWREPRAWKGEETGRPHPAQVAHRGGAPTGVRTGMGHAARGGGGMQRQFACPRPLCTPPFTCRVACEGGWARTRGRRGGRARRGAPRLPWQPIPAPSSQMGEGGGMSRRPTPVPFRGANERPQFVHERGRRPKEWWAVPRSLSCESSGARAKGRGAYLSRAALRPRLARRGGVARTPWREGETGCPYPAWGAPAGGVQRRGHAASRGGGMFAPPPPLHTLLRGRFPASLPAGGSLGRRAAFPRVSPIHGNAFLFTHCFSLFLLIFTLSLHGNTDR
jgi:hypothetical protein